MIYCEVFLQFTVDTCLKSRMLSQVLEYVLFYSPLKKQIKTYWAHVPADRKTYLVSLIASLIFKANVIFEVYFYIKILSKFHTSFFSKPYLRDNLGPRLLWLFELKDSSEAFCCSPSDQRSKNHCRRRYCSHCTCNNSARESENLKDLFCKSYILNLNLIMRSLLKNQ